MAQQEIAAVASFQVTLFIRRFDPETDTEPKWVDYDVQMHGTDRVLDALMKIKGEQDGTLTFRRSCGHGICGSDAMRINGRNRLACKTLIKDLGTGDITVEAIKGLPLEKDLVVDMEPFFAAYRAVKPFLIPEGHEPTKERLQSAEDRERFAALITELGLKQPENGIARSAEEAVRVAKVERAYGWERNDA